MVNVVVVVACEHQHGDGDNHRANQLEFRHRGKFIFGSWFHNAVFGF